MHEPGLAPTPNTRTLSLARSVSPGLAQAEDGWILLDMNFRLDFKGVKVFQVRDDKHLK